MDRERSEGNLAALLCALSFATGMGLGDHMEHGLKSAYIGLQVATALNLSNEAQEAVFYGALLKDVGCTACSAGISAFFLDDELVPQLDALVIDPSRFNEIVGWLSRNVPVDSRLPIRIAKFLSFLVQCGPTVKELMRGHCEVAEIFARRLGFPEYVQHTVRFQWERWDGNGLAYGLKAIEVPLAARILYLAQVLEVTYTFGDRSLTKTMAREKRGTRFDPEIVDAFLVLAEQSDFWKIFEHESCQDVILAMRPPTSADHFMADQTEDVCEALADLVDIKTRETWHHSRLVADLAVSIGDRLELSAAEQTKLRCAALVHDVGKVAIPYGILAKGDHRSKSEWETYYLHPYYTYRILEQVSPLQELATVAAAHHEWINGQGYHRQLSGEQIPLHGRILAVANAYARYMQQGNSVDSSEALNRMRSLLDLQFDRSCYDALVVSLTNGYFTKSTASKRQQLGNLTEREAEVLRLLAQGKSNPQIARTLSISRKTVEHHLTHIYNKIGVSCRTAAVVYAVQQGLV